MGHLWSQYLNDRDTRPNHLQPPTFDPLYGFPNGRKERVMVATQAEMESAKIPIMNRDYCAHRLIEYKACRQKVWPFAYQCAHEKHTYLNCEYDDYILRLKEYEREHRLLKRAKRKAAKEAASQELLMH